MVGTLGPGVGVGRAARFRYVATAGQTTFSGADASAQALTLNYTPGFLEVSVDGIWLSPDEYTATNGSSIVFASGLAAGRVVYAYALSTFSVGLNGNAISDLTNVSFSISASAGALTIALKDVDGNDPTTLNPITLGFRNATRTSGNPNVQRQITGANSIVIPSTSTMGVTSSKAFRIWITGWDDAGTFRLGVFNASDSSNIYPLNEGFPTTSLQVVAGGNAVGQHYTAGAAVTLKAFRILGYVDWTSTGLTAGTWTTTDINSIQTFGPGIAKPGERVQQALVIDGTIATGTTVTPYDNTIPQNTEGTQFISKAIIPTNAANILSISTSLNIYASAANIVAVLALFQDSAANALATGQQLTDVAGASRQITLMLNMVAQTNSSTTFKVRVGPNAAATVTMNGNFATPELGGTQTSFLKIEELMG